MLPIAQQELTCSEMSQRDKTRAKRLHNYFMNINMIIFFIIYNLKSRGISYFDISREKLFCKNNLMTKFINFGLELFALNYSSYITEEKLFFKLSS